jgi:hypothetical protein
MKTSRNHDSGQCAFHGFKPGAKVQPPESDTESVRWEFQQFRAEYAGWKQQHAGDLGHAGHKALGPILAFIPGIADHSTFRRKNAEKVFMLQQER